MTEIIESKCLVPNSGIIEKCPAKTTSKPYQI